MEHLLLLFLLVPTSIWGEDHNIQAGTEGTQWRSTKNIKQSFTVKLDQGYS